MAPNFLVIVADDLGFSDIGCFGGEIKTPNLDRIAREGLRFNDFHTASMCSPTRAMLMSGTDSHMAGVGVMYEYKSWDPERWNVAGHEGYLNHDVAALPEVLKEGGYHTMMAGKWHLGMKEGFLPKDRGFQRSWAMLPGCTNHFGYEPQAQDRTKRIGGHHPYLYVDEDRRYIPTPNTASDKNGFYSSCFYVDKLLEYFGGRDQSQREQPFFAFLPFAAPHWPLQCFAQDRDKYKGMYDDGPAALRLRRLKQLQKLGLISSDIKPHDVVADEKDWNDMTPEERRMSARSMEVYAGMVDRLDQEVGRVMDYLESTGELDHTFVLFMSDNGAEGAALEAWPTLGPNLIQAIKEWYNNTYENAGAYDSFMWYGQRWAQASTAPNRMFKVYTTEGGIRVPMMIRYPPMTQSKQGTICRSFCTVMDIMPTMLELAGIRHPNPRPSHPREKALFQGREVYGMRGKSWVPYLLCGQAADGSTEEPDSIHGPNDPAVGWELHALASLRKGNWKIVNMPKNWLTGTDSWQLYDLSVDQGETNDLASSRPDKLKELLKQWDQYVEETGTVFGKPMANRDRSIPLPPDIIGGDPMADQRAWMRAGQGEKLAN